MSSSHDGPVLRSSRGLPRSVLPGDPGYDEARSLGNGDIDRQSFIIEVVDVKVLD